MANHPHFSRRVRLRLETLESRLTPSWAGAPPAAIAVPSGAAAVALNGQASAQSTASITANEVDYYAFTAPNSGAFRVSATTPNSSLDTVLGVFNSVGGRVAYNDDISATNLDSSLTVTLTAGNRYFFGVTNYSGTAGGSYAWQIAAPSTTPAPTPGQSGFQITLRMTGLTASQQSIFNQAAARWSQIIVGDVANATYRGVAVDDVLIDASAAPIDGAGGTLGQAGPDAFRSGSSLPIHGSMEFDSADLASMEASGQLVSVVLHEMGHVLGIGTIWQNRGFLTGAGSANPRFTGPNAAWAYNNLFGTAQTSVPVEGNSSGVGSRDSHWRESVFRNELMTPYISGATNPISTVTAASLADLGYMINLAAANAFTPSGAALAAAGASGNAASLVQGLSLVTPSDIGGCELRLHFDGMVVAFARHDTDKFLFRIEVT